MHQEALQHDCN